VEIDALGQQVVQLICDGPPSSGRSGKTNKKAA
jgi:hypothetical protein